MTRTELQDELQSFGERIDAKLDAKFAILIEMFKTREAKFDTFTTDVYRKLDEREANFKTQEAENDVWRAEFSKKLDVGMDNIEKKLDVNLVATRMWFWCTACFFVATIIYVTYDIFTTITSITSSFTP